MIKNKFWVGLAWGFLLPALGAGMLYLFDDYMTRSNAGFSGFKNSSLVLYPLCLNILPTTYANRKLMDNFIRGIMLPTVIGCFIWLVYFDALHLFK